MKIVRATECRTTPWKNGGGSTTEIAVAPADASLDHFDWRVSVARVASNGPFSEFSGIDRTLAVVEGNGLALTIGSTPPVVLDRHAAPIRFAGDTPTSARLTAGEIVDLNVMTRRGRFEHRLQRFRAPTHCDFDGHDIAVVIACGGYVELSMPHTVTLAQDDAAILTRTAGGSFHMAPTAPAACYLVLLRECRDHAG